MGREGDQIDCFVVEDHSAKPQRSLSLGIREGNRNMATFILSRAPRAATTLMGALSRIMRPSKRKKRHNVGAGAWAPPPSRPRETLTGKKKLDHWRGA